MFPRIAVRGKPDMEQTGAASPRGEGALIDLTLVLGVSGAAMGLEIAFAEQLPWGSIARGVSAVLAGAAVAVLCTLRRHGSLAPLGLGRPRRPLRLALRAVAILATFLVAQAIVPLLLGNWFEPPAPDFSRYDAVRDDLAAALALAVALPLFAALPEEIVYRGFLVERIDSLLGSRRLAPAAAVIAQALLFGSAHFQWGLGGVLLATIMGLVWGVAFLLCGRDLWAVVAAHALAHQLFVLQLWAGPPVG
jgi:membrane protease YdiL (CAAX protease family)